MKEISAQINVQQHQCLSQEECTGFIQRHHTHKAGDGECASIIFQRVKAPIDVVWAVVRRFDEPQSYKQFVKSCQMKGGDHGMIRVGSVREVRVVSGLPASFSTERLEMLDDENHVLSFRVLGGEHRLHNYRSTTSLHQFGDGPDGSAWTVVIESYVVDVPEGNTEEDTTTFVDTVVRCNLQSLARLSERLALTEAKPPSSRPLCSL